MSRVTRGLTLAVVAFAVLLFVGPSASAQAGFGDCKTEPDPEYPGAGLVGQLDTATIQSAAPNSVYAEVGYAGLVWHAYDLGCMPSAQGINAPITTFTGNTIFDAAKTIVAGTIGLHEMIVEGGFIDRFDDLVVMGTYVMYQGVFLPLLGLVLTFLAVGILWLALRGRLAGLSKRMSYGVGALFLASASYLTPLLYVGFTDAIAVEGVAEIRGRVLDVAGTDGRDLPNVLHHAIVYEPWLVGVFGSADNRQARELGRELVRAQAYTRAEVAAGETGEDAAERKKDAYADVAERTGEAYPFFKGTNDTRVGAGMLALAKAVVFTPFQLITDAGILLVQLLMRVIVVLAPALALFALLKNEVLKRMITGVFGALVAVVLLAVSGSVHLFVMLWVTDPAREFSIVAQIVTMLLLTIVLWFVVRPERQLKSIVNAGSRAVGGPDIANRIPRPHPHAPSQETRAWWLGRQRHESTEGTRQRAENHSAEGGTHVRDRTNKGDRELVAATARPEGDVDEPTVVYATTERMDDDARERAPAAIENRVAVPTVLTNHDTNHEYAYRRRGEDAMTDRTDATTDARTDADDVERDYTATYDAARTAHADLFRPGEDQDADPYDDRDRPRYLYHPTRGVIHVDEWHDGDAR